MNQRFKEKKYFFTIITTLYFESYDIQRTTINKKENELIKKYFNNNYNLVYSDTMNRDFSKLEK